MRQGNYKSILKRIFVLSWAIVCIVVAMLYTARFSVLHGVLLDNIGLPPANLETVSAAQFFGDLLTSFLGIILFSIALISAGAIFLHIAKLNKDEKQNIFAFLALVGTSFLVGHWALASLFMLLAMFGNLTSISVTWTLLAALVVGIYPVFKHLILPIINRQLNPPNTIPEKKYRLILGMSIAILFLTLTFSTSRLGYDSVYIYFSDPKLTALTHRLQFFLNDLFVISSFQTGIQFSAIMLIFGDQTARLFFWMSGVFNIIFALALAEKARLSSRAKGIFLALVLTTTAFVDLLGDAKVDLTSSAVTIAAVYWMFADDNKNNKLLAGFFVGLSIASRPYNIFLMGVFTASLYLVRMYFNRGDPEKRGIRPFMRTFAWIGLGAVPPLAFHLAVNWAILGDLFAMLANTQNITSQKWQWAFDPQNIWIMRLLYPFVVTFLNTSQSIGAISPIFLAFLPNVFYGAIRKKINLARPLVEMLAAALVTLVLWIAMFFTIMEIRYIFFLWIILFIAIAEVVVIVLDRTEYAFQWIFSALVIVLLGFTILRVVYISLYTYSPIDVQGNPQCSDHVFCNYLKPINERAAQGERVLSLLAYRYYLRTDLFACSTRVDEYNRILEAARISPQEFWAEAYRQGYTYVAYENNYSVRHLYMDFIPDPATVPAWMELETLYGGPQEKIAAYRIIVHDAPVPREKACVQNNGVWEIQEIP